MVDLDQLNWDERLPYFTFAYNTSIHASTGCTPHFLLYGYEARQPIDMMLHQQEVVSNDSRFKRTLANIANWREEVDRVIQETYPDMKAKQKYYHDQRTHYKFLEVGDEAWLKNFKPRARGENKLNVRMRGPYRVVETFDKAPHTYRLQHKLNPDDMQIAHWSNLQFGKTNRRVGAEHYYNCADDESGRMPRDGSVPPGNETTGVLGASGSSVRTRGAGLLKPTPVVFEPVRGFDERSEHLSDIDIARGMEEEEEDEEDDDNETAIKTCWQRGQFVPSAEQKPRNAQQELSIGEPLPTEPSASAERRSGRVRKCPERYGYENQVDGKPRYADQEKGTRAVTVNTNRLVRTFSQSQLQSSWVRKCSANAERVEHCALAQSL